MTRRFLQKLKSKAGFTLAEVLIAVVVLLLVTSIVAAGIPVAQRAYANVIDAGNADVLASTTLNILRNELISATEVQVEKVTESGNTVYYVSLFKSGKTGFWTKIENSENGVLLTRYSGIPGDLGAGQSVLAVTSQASTNTLVNKLGEVTAGSGKVAAVTYSDGVFAIRGLEILRKNEIMASIAVYKVAALNEVLVRTY